MTLFDVSKKLLKYNVVKDDKVLVIFDNSKTDICNNFIDAFEEINDEGCLEAEIDIFNLDRFTRPLKNIPEALVNKLSESTLVFLFTDKYSNNFVDELNTLRIPLNKFKDEMGFRLGSLLNVNSDIFEEIFSYDPNEIKSLNSNLFNLIEKSKIVNIQTSKGTNISAKIDLRYNWINQDADLSKKSLQHSLFAGEVYGYPTEVNGALVVDGAMGGIFSKFDLNQELKIEVIDSKIVSVSSENKELEQSFSDFISKSDCRKRIGELGFGTNLSLTKFYNIIGIDEKFPGIHFAFGNPYPDKTKADWSCDSHIDCVVKEVDVFLDDVQILKKGKYLI